MKNAICAICGTVGAAIAAAFGGWSTGLATLIIFMAIDYFSGLIVAGVFHASKKTDTGALESHVGFKGLVKKCMILVFVLIGYRLDLMFDSTYVRDAVCIAFIVNELISIVENAGLMGIPVPSVISKAIDILKKKEDEES